MEIVLAKSAGFCFGVKRATQMAFEASEAHAHICSLGPIIHSPQVVQKLAEKGVVVIDKVEEIPEGAVIIRSHGVTAGEMQAILERDLTVVDATCPFVKKAQEYATRLAAEGYTVIIVGEAEHPEVQGIVSYADGGKVQVVANAAEAAALPRMGRVGIVAQTTQSFENLRQVADICLEKCQELHIFNTICDATTVRQNEARAIARPGRCDAGDRRLQQRQHLAPGPDLQGDPAGHPPSRDRWRNPARLVRRGQPGRHHRRRLDPALADRRGRRPGRRNHQSRRKINICLSTIAVLRFNDHG